MYRALKLCVCESIRNSEAYVISAEKEFLKFQWNSLMFAALFKVLILFLFLIRDS